MPLLSKAVGTTFILLTHPFTHNGAKLPRRVLAKHREHCPVNVLLKDTSIGGQEEPKIKPRNLGGRNLNHYTTSREVVWVRYDGQTDQIN